MNALFALALLASPLRAGVVMPVESGVVSPTGPSVTGLPVLSPTQGSLGTPTWGGIDLRGALPMLPAPVPGLAGPALNFIGQGVAPEAAAVAPQAGSPQAAPAPSAAAQGRRAEQTPAMPAKTAPGSSTLAISRDRKRAASLSDAAPSLTGKLSDENALSPRVDAGRKFFDLGSEHAGDVDEASGREEAPARSGFAAAAGQNGAGSFQGGATNLSGGAPLKAYTGGGKSSDLGASISEGETLHDAVASAPGAAAVPAAGGKVSFFRSASPNGTLGASAGSRGFGAFGMPKPLALDLSATGLIVRVRSALGSAMSAASFAAPQQGAVAPVPGPSTAMLERGGMLEAFATAQTHAASAAPSASASVETPSASRRISVPAPINSTPSSVPSLWWALLTLPLFVAAVRRVI